MSARLSAPSPRAPRTPLVICSKSAWEPAIRREHALAMLAAAHGHPVTFIERPLDVRALSRSTSAPAWWRSLHALSPAHSSVAEVRVEPHSTILPGHLNALAEVTSNLLLRRHLRHAADGAVVVNVPWQWAASAGVGGRRVFDCADDWSALMTHNGNRLAELYRRIGREADAIILASPSLAGRFPADRTVVVRNGVSEDMLGPVAPLVRLPRLVHAGTLTPRFDAELAAGILEALPNWSLDLYGQCQYPGCGERPGAELERLLAEYGPRVHWHGVIARDRLAGAIDHAAVSLILNRPELSLGQDSMKLYDYAARGRPIVGTRFSSGVEDEAPPHTSIAHDAHEMAEAILAGTREPLAWAADRRRWAEAQRWRSRWPAWSAAVFGEPHVEPSS